MIDRPAVLYVEDDRQSRKIMGIILEKMMGLAKVTIFEDSTDFISRVKNIGYIPDIIFLDIHMAPLTGFQMLALLRADPTYTNVPVVAMTASVMDEEIALLRQSGFNGIIPKPLNMETFPETLQRILNGEQI